jgi:hypothetical protein
MAARVTSWQTSTGSNYDDAKETVSFKMNVQEGLQFRMGRFITKGFTEAQDKVLHER